MKHESHEKIINRMKRAIGHLNRVVVMIEEGKPCIAIAQQFQAVSKAVVASKQEFIKDHLDHCLSLETEIDKSKLKKALEEIKEISKYLE